MKTLKNELFLLSHSEFYSGKILLVVATEIRHVPENAQKYIRSLEIENIILRKKLRRALSQKFGRLSEKIDPNQQELFGAVEVEADAPEAEKSTTMSVLTHARNLTLNPLIRRFPGKKLSTTSPKKKRSVDGVPD